MNPIIKEDLETIKKSISAGAFAGKRVLVSGKGACLRWSWVPWKLGM
jgi:hypothetical protein